MNETESGQPRKRPGVLLRALGWVDRSIAVVETWIIGGCILLMAAIMVGHVLGRIFFGQGIPGTFEVTELLIILITFVGVSYGVRKARHISMSALYDQLSGRVRKTALVVICLITGTLMFYLAWESWLYTDAIRDRGRTTSSLQLPLWIVYMSLPVGFTLAGIQYWLTAVRNVTTEGIYRSFNEKERYGELPVDADIAGGDDAAATDTNSRT